MNTVVVACPLSVREREREGGGAELYWHGFLIVLCHQSQGGEV
jgi:hypothetical protein